MHKMQRLCAALAATVLLIGAGVASAAPGDPRFDDAVAVARLFAERLVKDRQAAAGMVSADAQMGFGDMAGAFDMAVFAEGLAQCRYAVEEDAAARQQGMPGRAITAVPVMMTCPDEHGTPRTQAAQIMVEQGRIAGFYVP